MIVVVVISLKHHTTAYPLNNITNLKAIDVSSLFITIDDFPFDLSQVEYYFSIFFRLPHE